MPRRRRSAAWFAPNFLFSEEPKGAAVVMSVSVLKRVEVDLGATLVPLQIAACRIIEQDSRTLDEAVVESLSQVDLLVLEIWIERRHHLERAVHSLASDDPGPRIDQQVGFQRFDVDPSLTEKYSAGTVSTISSVVAVA